MKIPKGLTEDEVVGVITKIARRLAPKFTFASYDVEDIEQEAFLIGIAGLEKYDPELFEHVQLTRELRGLEECEDNSEERLGARRKVLQAKLERLQRNL